MKKSIYLIPLFGFMVACSGVSQQEQQAIDAAADSLKEQTQRIEQSTESLDESIQASDAEMTETQNEIDSLLNDI